MLEVIVTLAELWVRLVILLESFSHAASLEEEVRVSFLMTEV